MLTDIHIVASCTDRKRAPVPLECAFGRSTHRTSGHGQGAGGSTCVPICIRPLQPRISTRAIIGASSWSFPPWPPKLTCGHTSGWYLRATDSSPRTRPFGPTRRLSVVATLILSPPTLLLGVRLRLTASGGRPYPRKQLPTRARLAASAVLPNRAPTPAFLSWPLLLMSPHLRTICAQPRGSFVVPSSCSSSRRRRRFPPDRWPSTGSHQVPTCRPTWVEPDSPCMPVLLETFSSTHGATPVSWTPRRFRGTTSDSSKAARPPSATGGRP